MSCHQPFAADYLTVGQATVLTTISVSVPASSTSKKLKGDELLVTAFAATRLRMDLDRVPLWRGDHVSIKQVVEDFARCLHLPRIGDPTVLRKW